ncbi:MAG: cytosolic protein [Methylococcaceae bacterium]
MPILDNKADELIIDEYDSPWKEAVEHYFSEFIESYFSQAYQQIDWTKEAVFLDQELRAVVHDAELGKRFVDKLVRVTLLDGDEKWIYIHIEVQGTRQAEFAKRMFVYNYRIYDRYDRPVASLAVLADEHKNWKPASYGFEVLGCKHFLEFPVAKLTDYHDQLEALKTSENTFAIITAAHILTQQTRKNDKERYEAKYLLVKILYQRKWDKQRIIDLFRIIDWMMKLPTGLEQQLQHQIKILEESTKMQYVTSMERLAIAKGLEQGLEQGVLKGEQKTLRRLILRRFQTIPDWAIDRISQASEIELEQWLDNVLDATTLEAVFTDLSAAH